MADPVADFITRLKNAAHVGKDTVTVPHSKLVLAVAETLKRAGYLSEVERHGRAAHRTIAATIQFEDEEPKVHDVKRISKPSRRVYLGTDKLFVRRGLGDMIVSTPRGIMTATDARKAHVGGEALFEIW